ncbi:hypothetical protein ACHQM5_015631 [Ranunculus cassubicifolius]
MGTIAGDEMIHMEKALDVAAHDERIMVSVRLRPLNGKEISKNDVSDWECINDNTVLYRNAINERSMYPNAYTFDRVFGHDSPTKKVYDEAAKDVALSVVSGINASIFAYGQTSSGKTYTMSGITEFTVEDIYAYVERHNERTFILKFSAMEIYNEAVRDLLSTDQTPLRLLDDPERGTVVDRLTEETLRDLDHLKELLSMCEAQRQIGETTLNEMSSRSHQILRLTIESSAREFMGKDNSSTLSASVDFVDLAGSERASQTLSAGTRLKEGCHINRSLLTLGTVVRKLSKGRNGHIPYRDSKLTRILQCSLGGNARTAIICTISPARSHVEQSRNTLSFANCAKEVATNAQVNVVMSDKALVKHLQKELARLEGELTGLGSTSPSLDSAALLREKDLQIEKMEKEIQDLKLQRDLAQSRLGNLVQSGDDQALELLDESDQYPRLRAPLTVVDEPVHFVKVGVRRYAAPQCSSGCSEASSSEHPTENQEENFLFDSSSPQFSTISPKFLGPDPYNGWEGITQGDGDDFEELCKDVQCIELDESTTNRIVVRNTLTCSRDEEKLPLELSEAKIRTEQAYMSPPQNRYEKLSKDHAEFTYDTNEHKFQDVQKTIDCVDSPLPDASYQSDVSEDKSSPRSLARSSSYRASLLTNSSSPPFEKEEKDVNTPPSGSEKDYPARPHEIQRKLSTTLNYKLKELLSRNNSIISGRSDLTDENTSQHSKNFSQDDVTSINTFVAGLKEMTKLQYKKPVVENQGEDTGRKTNASAKSVKDVGLDPMQDSPESPPSWNLEFERKQREIIKLWQTCDVSLVHRTYFFLLFKGDPSDSIYLEVEHRRLTFLKDLSSQGNLDKLPIEGARDLNPASSMKALRREREMLSKQMQKKFSEEEREQLYEKWGIGLNTKQRRLQLSRRLWTDTTDMDHITESANLVAKLLGLKEPRMALKEMFILSFTPQKTSRRSYSWRSST